MSFSAVKPLRTLSTLLLLASSTQAAETTAQSQAEPEISKQAVELFKSPQGDLAAKLNFIDELVTRQPPEGDQRQQLAHQRKVARSVVATATEALEEKPTGEQAVQTHFFLLQGLSVLRQLEEPKIEAELSKAIEAACKHKSSEVAGIGMKFFIEDAYDRWPTLREEGRKSVVAKITNHLITANLAPQHVMVAINVADFVAVSGDTKLATELIEATLPKFKDAESPEIREQAKVLEGIQRRINLPGKSLKLTGRRLGKEEEGEKFDWGKYRGKVVLIDFWASWCGPCRAELPNVSRLYRAYHDKGFEVVGINLDNKPEQARKFIAEKRLPWATLYSFEKSKRGWSDPRAVEFGVTGIPFAILIDRDGNVIDTHAREQHLVDLLRDQLGEPLASLEAAPKAMTAAKVKLDDSVQPVSSE
ncbi:TlpA family protein disulfide reductase [Adhaeretor mobilis]|uniref:Thiol-disulfide oxidoreductase ResA n=1 Tax=Adhaeretor mobilis TaxID=1930276 RepID=A0A517MRC1_9BACT|nr:TlpA disulfide reductase family protein [Adhaeretor mobilis]QDS97416.1 Thiol-disulfide oxidoreductase ResA [Adhaeretor mobilis]